MVLVDFQPLLGPCSDREPNLIYRNMLVLQNAKLVTVSCTFLEEFELIDCGRSSTKSAENRLGYPNELHVDTPLVAACPAIESHVQSARRTLGILSLPQNADIVYRYNFFRRRRPRIVRTDVPASFLLQTRCHHLDGFH